MLIFLYIVDKYTVQVLLCAIINIKYFILLICIIAFIEKSTGGIYLHFSFCSHTIGHIYNLSTTHVLYFY